MKKTLLSLSSLAALSASMSAAPIDLTATTAESPYDITSATDQYVLSGNRPDMSVWIDGYIKPSVADFNSIIASSGSNGWHSNVHFMLDASNSTVTTSSKQPFDYNDFPMGDISGNTISLGYYLESADGSAVKIINSNYTDGQGMVINLATTDSAFSGSVYGKQGRTFSVGENVTLQVEALNVSGKLTTSETEFTQSLFNVAGTVTSTNGVGLYDTNFNVAGTGLIDSAGGLEMSNSTTGTVAGELKSKLAMNIKNGANVTVSGKINSGIVESGTGGGMYINNATLSIAEGGQVYAQNTIYVQEGAIVNIDGIFTGGNGMGLGGAGSVTTIGETGWLKIGFALKGGELIVNGKITNATGAMNNTISVDYDSAVSFGANAQYSVSFNLNGAALTVKSDATVNTLRNLENKTSSITVTDGYTLTTNNSNFNIGSTTDFNGNLNFKTSLYLADSASTLNINSGTTTTGEGIDASASGTSFSNNGTVLIYEGATLHTKSYNAEAWWDAKSNKTGNIVIDGGTLKAFSNISDSYSIVINKSVQLMNGGQLVNENIGKTHIAMTAGELSFDATSQMETNTFVFAGTDAKEIIFAAASNLKKTTVLKVVRSNNNKISLAADNTFNFGQIQFHDKNVANAITFDLNGGKLNIDSLGVMSVASVGTITFEDFALGSVKIWNGLTTELISSGTFTIGNLTATFVGYDVNGNLLDGTWGVDDYGYLFNSALVPEPADFAVIFGALAIALAIYRRRS